MAETLLHEHNIFTNNILEDTDLKKIRVWHEIESQFIKLHYKSNKFQFKA